MDPFALLGFAQPRFHIDARELERAYLARSRAVHPDRFVNSGDEERRRAAQQMVALNDAYRVLQQPFDRAVHLVTRAGVEMGRLDQRLLVELMEMRERAEESAQGKAEIVAAAKERFAARMGELEDVLRIVDATPEGYAAPSTNLDKAARLLAELKTLARLVDDLGGGKLIVTLEHR